MAKKKVLKKKPAKKKTVKKKKVSSKPSTKKSTLQIAGKITHYFPHVSAGVIKLAIELKKGDIIHMKGHTTNFKQTVDSIQIDRVPVDVARRGEEIGIKVKDRVRIGDIVYKL